ncbi:MAG: helix-turn-helix domain-containing protein [Cyclobacteriaceae bacterium]|nr:helix-turn-helix domain-containing protein [Cyclobacteriaceae bacterium]
MVPEDFSNADSAPLSRDLQFLKDVREVIERNLENEKFGVSDLAGKLALSRISLYRKFHRLTGKKVTQYIREIRLEKAMQLLRQDVATISEIAYRVGFGSPTYFTRCFHEQYGYPPGEVKNHFVEEETAEGKDQEKFSPGEAQSGNNRYFRYGLFVLTGAALVFTVLFYFMRWSGETVPADTHELKSVAVLPFRNDSADPDNNFFCSNLEEEILNRLQKVSSILVRPHQSMD